MEAHDSSRNLVVSNTASGNSTDYAVSATNARGEVHDFSAGGTISLAAPWANLRY